MSDRVREIAAPVLKRHDTPGAAVSLIVDGSVQTSIGVGTSDLEGAVPLDGNARFPLYSITKTYVATAILKLVESGELHLDDPIAPILPELSLDPEITLRQMLNHTSGLPDYGGMAAYSEDLRRDPATPWTSAQFLERTLARGYSFAPGKGWAYSNIGYLILKLVVERVAGTSLRQVIAEYIAQPLGLTQTSVAETIADLRDVTPGFGTALNEDGALHDISDRYHPGWVSHGLIVSTAPEVAIFLDALMAGRLLGPEMLAAMVDGIRVPFEGHPFFHEPSYGLGLMTDPAGERGLIVGHAGGGPGYATGALHVASKDGGTGRVTAVALANRDNAEIGLEIAFRMLDA